MGSTNHTGGAKQATDSYTARKNSEQLLAVKGRHDRQGGSRPPSSPLESVPAPEWLRRRISSPHGSSPPVHAATPTVWRPGLGQALRRRVSGGGSLDGAAGDYRGARSCVLATPSCRFELLSSFRFLHVLICTSSPPSLSSKFELETVKSLAGGRG